MQIIRLITTVSEIGLRKLSKSKKIKDFASDHTPFDLEGVVFGATCRSAGSLTFTDPAASSSKRDISKIPFDQPVEATIELADQLNHRVNAIERHATVNVRNNPISLQTLQIGDRQVRDVGEHPHADKASIPPFGASGDQTHQETHQTTSQHVEYSQKRYRSYLGNVRVVDIGNDFVKQQRRQGHHNGYTADISSGIHR
ncbi:hypothetical protein OGATHE_003831 [Ogataea polymorpha]|uniref:Uncharacterized protein n=1 Tax=Ogataea polymorpha TaxID=460523 RepID=A0A9P8T4M2_9ASCO|nr:hypothetical protein OGATHE_003831 [Ogataea polymorpha]